MSTARYGVGGNGVQTSALVFGGYDNSSWFNNTEEWTISTSAETIAFD